MGEFRSLKARRQVLDPLEEALSSLFMTCLKHEERTCPIAARVRRDRLMSSG